MNAPPQLSRAVQRNCDISDARHAGDYGLCTYLLKMREYYRWENALPYARALSREALGAWLTARERHLESMAEEEFGALPLEQGSVDPFDAGAVNRELLPQGWVYGAGYGRQLKPVFFLGRLQRIEQRAGLTILVGGQEHARELAAPPAVLQQGVIVLRRESIRSHLWEKVEGWLARGQAQAMQRALQGYDFAADADAALERLAEREMQTLLLHEVGEAMAGELLGEAWGEMVLALARTRHEPVARAVRDLLADCLSTLPALLGTASLPALHFYFATFDAPRRDLFPTLLDAYGELARGGAPDRLRQVVAEGRERWLDCARGLLALSPARRELALAELLPPSAR